MNKKTEKLNPMESKMTNDDRIINFPAQHSCGHLFLEKYVFSKEAAKEAGCDGFAWCGFCGKRENVKADQDENE